METIRTHTGDGVTTVYNVDFDMGYLTRNFVYVYIGGYSEYLNQMTYTWISDTQIALATAPLTGVEFSIRRVVDREDLYNNYVDGALLHNKNLNDSFRQALMILEEIEDGFVTSPNSSIDNYIRVDPSEQATITAVTVPPISERARSFFLWDDQGDITPIVVEDVLDYIGGVHSIFGRTGDVVALVGDYSAQLISFNNAYSGLNATNTQDAIDEVVLTKYAIAVTAGQTVLDIPSPFSNVMVIIDGVTLLETASQYIYDGTLQKVQLAVPLVGTELVEVWANNTLPTTRADADNIVTSVFTRIGDVIAQANDYTALQVSYTSPYTLITATEVQTALDQLGQVIGAIADGVRLRGLWDAATNIPNLAQAVIDGDIRGGDYFWVSVIGETPLTDPDGSPITGWKVGDRALYLNYDGDGVPADETIGWVKVQNSDTLPATNITFDSTQFVAELPLPFVPPTTSQTALDFSWEHIANVIDSQVGKDLTIAKSTGSVDELLAVGFTAVTALVVGLPVAEDGHIITSIGNAGDASQIFISTSTNMYIRVRIGTIWGNWVALAVSGGSAVTSVFGRAGAVIAVKDDYTAEQVKYTSPYTLITATDVQTALDQYGEVIIAITSGVRLRGTWDAALNVPDLAQGVLNGTVRSGDYWWVDVAGSTPLLDPSGSPITGWTVGDKALYVFTSDTQGWFKIQTSDTIPASNVTFAPTTFTAELPAEVVPTTAQSALDFGWEHFANVIDSNVGKTVIVPISSGTVDDLTQTGSYFVTSGVVGLPEIANSFLQVVAGSTVNDTAQHILTALNNNYSRVQVGGVWSIWEIMGGVGAVSTVHGRTGDVVANLVAPFDYHGSYVGYTSPYLIIDAVNVQSALDQYGQVIIAITSGVRLKGSWDAATNTPDLPALVLASEIHSGDYYWVTVAGETPLNDPDGVPITGWEVNQKALYIEDGTTTGWIKIDTADTLPATLITFDTTIFEQLFPTDTPPTNAQLAIDFGYPHINKYRKGNIQPTGVSLVELDTITVSGWYNTGIGETPNGNRATYLHAEHIDGYATQVQYAQGAGMFIRENTNYVWGAWEEVGGGGGDYLPITGGAVTGLTSFTDSVATHDIAIKSGISNRGGQISLQNTSGVELATVSCSDNNGNTSLTSITGDAAVVGITASLRIKDLGGTVITPIIRASDTRASIGGTGSVEDSFHVNLSTFDVNTKGDITAFRGGVAVTQPHINATGATSAYDLIELLLDKVEELETRLANAGIA